MKRNPEIIRNILLACERAKPLEQLSNADVECDSGQEWEVSEHIRLLDEAGFIRATISKELNPQSPPTCYIRGITWDGYEYLDTIRDPEIWSKTKGSLAKVGGTLSIELIMAIAKHAVREKLGLEV